MKFKTIFVIFNIIIIVSFGFIFLMPLPILGLDYALGFWAQNWLVGLLFVAILTGLDWYFLTHWKLLHLFEREDWAGLLEHLDEKIYGKKRVDAQSVKFYITSSLLLGMPDKINRLRESLTLTNPALARRLALSLGLPLVLSANPVAMRDYFLPFLDRGDVQDRPWVRWVCAFALVLGEEDAKAKEILVGFQAGKPQPLLQLLSLYLLETMKGRDPEAGRLVEPLAAALKKALTAKEWDELIEKAKEKLLLVSFLHQFIGQARDWLAAYEPPVIAERPVAAAAPVS